METIILTGYANVYRRIQGEPWYKDPVIPRVFLDLYFNANYSDVDGLKIGQCRRSTPVIMKTLNLTERQIRTALKKLSDFGEITVEASKRRGVPSLITILKYNENQRITDVKNDTDKTTDKTTDKNKPQNIDLYNNTGNFGEFATDKTTDKMTPKMSALEKDINNINNNFLSLSYTREKNEKFFEQLENDLLFQTCWREDVQRALNVADGSTLVQLFGKFKNEQIAKQKAYSGLQDVREHFISWAKIEIEKQQKQATYFQNNGNNDRSSSKRAYEPTGNEDYFERI